MAGAIDRYVSAIAKRVSLVRGVVLSVLAACAVMAFASPASAQTGACCGGQGNCIITTALNCQQFAGFYLGNGSTCATGACSGACCAANGTCTISGVIECILPGRTWRGSSTTCTPSACLGACCAAGQASCTLTAQLSCSGAFRGIGSVCAVPATSTNFTTCCKANFDGINGVDVPDIFAFLAAWFSSQPAADIGGDGTVTVPDIFAFLALWFAGCT